MSNQPDTPQAVDKPGVKIVEDFANGLVTQCSPMREALINLGWTPPAGKASSGWQDISTAPKKFKTILLTEPEDDDDLTGIWLTYTGWWAEGKWKSDARFDVEPTHWMPLPQPPEGSDAA